MFPVALMYYNINVNHNLNIDVSWCAYHCLTNAEINCYWGEQGSGGKTKWEMYNKERMDAETRLLILGYRMDECQKKMILPHLNVIEWWWKC